jgi:hypothetical protein
MIKKIIINTTFATLVVFTLVTSIAFADTGGVNGPTTVNGFALIENPIGNGTTIPILIGKLLKIVAELGAVVCIFFIIYSGFLFIKAQGDPGELTKAKNTFLWSVVGAAVLLGASVIADIIVGTVDSVINKK